MAIRLDFPNVWTVGDAIRAIREAAKMIVYVRRAGVKSPDVALAAGDLRSFARIALVKKPRNSLLSPAHALAFNQLLLRVVRVTTAGAAAANARQPSVSRFQRSLRYAVATEHRLASRGAAMAGADFGYPAPGIEVLP